jgi:GNAT superfamily N-acetyltransferase
MKLFSWDPLNTNKESESFMEDFENCPREVFADNPEQILYVQSQSKQMLSKANPFFEHGEAQAFLLSDHGRLLGRIVASIDHNRRSKLKVGNFGFFECVQDQEASARLFEAAIAWLKSKGCEQIEGPVDLSVYYKYRFQVAGFEREPFLSEPRNPVYYMDLCEKAGFEIYKKWNSYDMVFSSVKELYSVLIKNLERKSDSELMSQLSIEYLDKERFESQMRFMKPVVMDIFAQNYGYSDLDEKEFIQISSPLFDVIRSEQHLKCLDKNRNLLGFGYAFDDCFPFFKSLANEETTLSSFQDFRCNRVIMHTFGVLRSCQGKGISEYILCHFLKRLLERDVEFVVGALCVDKLRIFQPFSEGRRSYAVFKKKLA